MKQRDFLLWLMLVPCLTIKGRYRIWQYMDKNKLTNINIGKRFGKDNFNRLNNVLLLQYATVSIQNIYCIV
jgi:hypothetical protein